MLQFLLNLKAVDWRLKTQTNKMDLIREIFGNEALMFGMQLQGLFVAIGVVLVYTIGKRLSYGDKLAFVW